ncbi:hypothetical protein Tco_0332144 [Tanacetum coccineum]
MAEPVLEEYITFNRNIYISGNDGGKIVEKSFLKLRKEHLKELQNNAFSGSEEKDVIDLIAKVLDILDSIKTSNMDTDRLRVHAFPFSLTGATRKWWINEGSDKVTAWDHRRMDGMTKSALWNSWIKGGGNNELIDDIVSSDKEWEESDYGNPPNTNIDSFFKPYLDAREKGDICLIEKELRPKNHSCSISMQNNVSCFDDKKNDLINEGVQCRKV